MLGSFSESAVGNCMLEENWTRHFHVLFCIFMDSSDFLLISVKDYKDAKTGTKWFCAVVCPHRYVTDGGKTVI